MNIFKLDRPRNVDEAIELLEISKALLSQAQLALTLLELAPDRVWERVCDYDTIADANKNLKMTVQILV